MSKPTVTITPKAIDSSILDFDGVRVMLDRDLAALYGVSTKVLKQAVRRNIERFSDRFHVRSRQTAIPSVEATICDLQS